MDKYSAVINILCVFSTIDGKLLNEEVDSIIRFADRLSPGGKTRPDEVLSILESTARMSVEDRVRDIYRMGGYLMLYSNQQELIMILKKIEDLILVDWDIDSNEKALFDALIKVWEIDASEYKKLRTDA